MSLLCEAVAIPRYTNNQVRLTSIQRFKRAGVEDREAMCLPEHQTIQNLTHYDPGPIMKRKLHLSSGIMGYNFSDNIEVEANDRNFDSGIIIKQDEEVISKRLRVIC